MRRVAVWASAWGGELACCCWGGGVFFFRERESVCVCGMGGEGKAHVGG